MQGKHGRKLGESISLSRILTMLVPFTRQLIQTPVSWEQRLLGRNNRGRQRRGCCLPLRGTEQLVLLLLTMWMALC